LTTPPRRPTPASRTTRRSRRPAPRSATFVERNRTRLLWGGGILVFVLLVGMAFLGFTRQAYACLDIFDPTPAPSFVAPTTAPAPGSPAPASGSPAPAVTAPPPGYVQPDMGHVHADPGSTIRYTSCPPASGRHYDAPLGPIRYGYYGPDEAAGPPGWVHNLEHGALVLLYRCAAAPGSSDAPNDSACSDERQQALQALLARWPASPLCKIPATDNVVIARFDEMASPYAALVWDVILPLETLDETMLFEFYARQAEQFNPEPRCPDPTPTPGPTPTAGPPTASPGASQPASPAVSPVASPAASTPASSAAPSPS